MDVWDEEIGSAIKMEIVLQEMELLSPGIDSPNADLSTYVVIDKPPEFCTSEEVRGTKNDGHGIDCDQKDDPDFIPGNGSQSHSSNSSNPDTDIDDDQTST